MLLRWAPMVAATASALALVLALHPFSTPSAAFAQRATATATSAEPGSDVQPGWDDPPAEEAAPTGEVPPPEVTPATAPPPSSVPTVALPPGGNAKPKYTKGTGLIIGASITGGLGWIAALTRLAFVKQCENAIEDAGDLQSGAAAGWTCFARAGVGNVALAIPQYTLNAATWGLAAGAGAVRGRYDGVEDAWSGKPSRKTNAFIGAGAGLLALGIVGRITAAATVRLPFRHVLVEDPADIDAKAFARDYRARLIGVQLSSAVIGLGAGLLAYGVAYKKHHSEQSKVIQQVRVTPDFNLDPRSGMGYGGLALSGRF